MATVNLGPARMGSHRLVFDQSGTLAQWFVSCSYDVLLGGVFSNTVGKEADILPLLNPGDQNHARQAATAMKAIVEAW